MGSSQFQIDVEDGGVELELKFPGWMSVPAADGDLHLTLVRDIQ
jgi:hypothetical protein